ncbi:Urease accessory protein UreF [Ascidiaceihabitans donghaensis]|uniref:Urease accessory protein UreF n=2 Tax=Ascidiaceihabitans donghaensis TaxID=1510460 RepID=A0A2R8BDT6_9RHOB|nr:Urease accessory protein UreF [Ascidiaceihabitans donghaensis]
MAEPILMNTVQPRMTTNTDVLTLSQLFSPSFPVGSFAYSHGLETAMNDGAITSAATLEAWVLDLLQFGSARSDAVLLNVAYAGSDNAIPMIDAQARAFAGTAERLRETDLQGAAFCETVQAVWNIDLGQLCYPVAVGRAAVTLRLDPELATAMYLQAFTGNLIAAAMRLVPLGQIDGQKVQTTLKPHCVATAKHCVGATLDDLHSCAWLSDIVSMRHETQYSRIFRS